MVQNLTIITQIIFMVLAGLCGLGSIAFAEEIPKKITLEEARKLAGEALPGSNGGGALVDAPADADPNFIIFQGYSPRSDNGSFGFFAVNPWTGDVWSLAGNCRRLMSPSLKKAQMTLHRKFSADERTHYASLHKLRPECQADFNQ